MFGFFDKKYEKSKNTDFRRKSGWPDGVAVQDLCLLWTVSWCIPKPIKKKNKKKADLPSWS